MTQADRGLYYTLVYHTFTAPNGPACCTRKARSAVTQPGTVANIIFITVVNIISMSASFANVMITMSISIMSATPLAQCFTLPARFYCVAPGIDRLYDTGRQRGTSRLDLL